MNELMAEMDNDYWAVSDNTYSGAPNECGWHFRNGEIVKLDDKGDCPKAEEHPGRDY
ncbi:hypothetical protein GCM10010423_65570 [Streptomyces levis]|uniref:Uncharacterized protein n=1 Tax=Streptomyces levis TaxID=285566 RepID=A0ABN3P2B8_9ACTN